MTELKRPESFFEQVRHGIADPTLEEAHTVLEKTVCVATHPGKMALHPLRLWFRKRYHGKYKNARFVFMFDLFLLGIALGLAAAAVIFLTYQPSSIGDRVYFSADIAPAEIVTGAPSTLVISYTNGTGEELRNVFLTLTFPDHFLLQEISRGETLVENRTIALGTLPPEASGNIKIRGVMFGDVGGEQVFRSLLSFTYGEENKQGQKISSYTFSPARSTLALELRLPDQLVAYQPLAGTIAYKNTGAIDFPEITLEPKWPDQFTFGTSAIEMTNGAWRLPAIAAGQEGTVDFAGRLGNSVDSVTFILNPSFTFGETSYKQESLVKTIPLVPPQVTVSHSVDANSVRPGSLMKVKIAYENTGDTPVEDLTLSIASDSPFVKNPGTVKIGTLAAHESGEAELSVPIRSSILQSETNVYENLSLTTRATATFLMGDGTKQEVTSEGESISIRLITPVVLDAFGRYASPQGDQLGRGPLPPTVGFETTYWVFWNVSGTTNPLSNVKLTGQLPGNVRFTGKQTVSQDEGVTYDAATNTVSWTSGNINPTFPPGSKIVGIAFEVGVTPTDAQAGAAASLMTNITLTATDATTGAFVSASGANVTTNLPHDTLAAGLGTVIQ